MSKPNRMKDLWKSHQTEIWACVLAVGILVWTFLITSREIKIDKKVSAYEKTLPGYLEQKQRVEHYRDSLKYSKLR